MIYPLFLLDKVIRDTSSPWYLDYLSYSRKKAVKRLQYSVKIINILLSLGHHPENCIEVLAYSLQRDLCSQRIFEIDSGLDHNKLKGFPFRKPENETT